MTIDTLHTQLRTILLTFVIVAASPFCHAQEGMAQSKRLRHELTLGYGWGTLTAANGYSDKDNKFPMGNIHLQYLYNVSRHIGLGVLVDYTHSYIPTRNVCFDYDEVGRFVGGHLEDVHNGTEWFTFSQTARLYWFNHKHFAMYSRFGFGILLSSGYDSREMRVMPNISLVSLELGGRRLRFCTELLSIGSYGLFNGGLKYSF